MAASDETRDGVVSKAANSSGLSITLWVCRVAASGRVLRSVRARQGTRW